MEPLAPEILVKQLIEAGLATAETIVGCSDDEISEIENNFKIELPLAYKGFLKVMGKEAGTFLNDCLFLYPAVITCRSLAEEKIEELGITLGPTEYVFLERDNLFMFFDTDEGDDPAIFLFEQSQEEIQKAYDSYSEWLTVVVTDTIDIVQDCT